MPRQPGTKRFISVKKSSAALSTSVEFIQPFDGRCCNHPFESRSPFGRFFNRDSTSPAATMIRAPSAPVPAR